MSFDLYNKKRKWAKLATFVDGDPMAPLFNSYYTKA